MKKGLLAVFVALVVLAVSVGVAGAVTDGELDGDGHPYVVLLLMDVGGEPTYRCSATMLSPTVVLTAGHCTSNYPGDPYTGMRIYTESDVDGGDGTTNDYTNGTCNLGNCYEAESWDAHPLYETAPFWFHDVGVVVLENPFYPEDENGDLIFGDLPTLDQLDSMKGKRHFKDNFFTAVGYGLQKSFPDAAAWKDVADRVRMVAYPHLIQINTPGFTGDFSLLLSNNTATGGTCFGDSGGPNFIEDTNVIAAVTSFGMNGTCGGTGGVFRMDRQNVLDFVNSFLE